MASSSLNSVAINLSFGIRKTPYQGEEHSLQGLPIIRLYWDFFSLTNENHKQRAWCYVYYYWDFVTDLGMVIVVEPVFSWLAFSLHMLHLFLQIGMLLLEIGECGLLLLVLGVEVIESA